MIGQTTATIQQMVEEVLRQSTGTITYGLLPAQADWAIAAYRNAILPRAFMYSADEGPAMQLGRIKVAVGDIQQNLGGILPQAKWDRIVAEYYHLRLEPISEAAFQLALDFYEKKRPLSDLQPQASSLYEDAQKLREEITASAPRILPRLDEELSDTILDCKYVLGGGGDIISLRLNRAVSRPMEDNRCPVCGAETRVGSKFCDQCGARLVQS
jgi:hypothetical protein